MVRFILRRLIGLVPVAIGVCTITALMIHFVPGDPVDAILGDMATAEDRENLQAALGLDRPVSTQLIHFFKDVFHGNLGTSLLNQRPVTELILERARPTAELALAGVLVSLFMSLPLGILSALKAGKWQDYFAMAVALLGVAMPNFWLGPILVLIFSIHLDLFPVSERTNLSSYILPAITLGTALASVLSRMTRNSMLEALSQDYIRTARAKGNSERVVIWKHALRNAAIPLATIVGLQFGVLLTGAVITERIFDWPGLGTLMLEALFSRDYPVVQGCVLIFSGTYLFVNLLTDITYGIIDPRIRVE